MRQQSVDFLEQIYCCSPPWESKPRFEIGDRIHCLRLSEDKVVRGIVYAGLWVYYVPHAGSITRMVEDSLDVSECYSFKDYGRSNFTIGDIVECPFLGIKKTLVIGLIYNTFWEVAIANPNKPTKLGLPRIEVLPESYLRHYAGG